MEPLPPYAALLVPAALPAAALLPGMRLARTHGPVYRAVFARARSAGDDRTEE